jgi:hypothetical protein
LRRAKIEESILYASSIFNEEGERGGEADNARF